MDTHQGWGCQRVDLRLEEREGRGRPICPSCQRSCKNPPLSFGSHPGVNRQQIEMTFQHRKEEMQIHRLLISPAIEVKVRKFPQCIFPGKAGELL